MSGHDDLGLKSIPRLKQRDQKMTQESQASDHSPSDHWILPHDLLDSSPRSSSDEVFNRDNQPEGDFRQRQVATVLLLVVTAALVIGEKLRQRATAPESDATSALSAW